MPVGETISDAFNCYRVGLLMSIDGYCDAQVHHNIIADKNCPFMGIMCPQGDFPQGNTHCEIQQLPWDGWRNIQAT